MTVELSFSLSVPASADAVATFVYSDLARAGGGSYDERSARQRGFAGKLGESIIDARGDGVIEITVGLGERGRVDAEKVRRAGAQAARAAFSCGELAIDARAVASSELAMPAVVRALGEGAALASYSFVRFRSAGDLAALARVVIVGSADAESAVAIERAVIVAQSVTLARDLVNTPAGELTPRRFAEIAVELATSEGLEVRVLDEVDAAREGLGGLLGVAAGSAEPPRLIRLSYEPADATKAPVVALVGKGITFDSGGLSLKSAGSMMTMKTDMSGAAAVLATLGACRRLNVQARVVGFMPVTENMPGGRAIKPGDVLRIRNGKTIEVLNTDAEGRLVLADALSLASEEHPDAVVDLATLTGACVTALGRSIAGVLGNDDRLIGAVRSAASRAGEALWPLPLPTGYRSQIDSEIADMKNIGADGQAGAIAAALLLEEFVAELPWVHLDIAGPARSEEDRGYLRKGGTGFGVRTLIELLLEYELLGGRSEERAEGTVVYQ